ncbi:MAG: hypothetical protein J3K34DRAFT_17551 [Monoraphidium minutum]|nr:MAG: hypothetical protein J3K34DRAFT_17551 [Monoraphidium minutum]
MRRVQGEESMWELPSWSGGGASGSGSGEGGGGADAGAGRHGGAHPHAQHVRRGSRLQGAQRGDALVPWRMVEDALSMAHDALAAKQRAAEALRAEAERLQERTREGEQWSKRATRAETDSGLLLGQLETLLQAKVAMAHDRAELGRGISILRAERDLLCQQLRVDPEAGNLCHAVESALANARRAAALEAQLRALARQRRGAAAEAEAAREARARERAAWQAREDAYLAVLAAAGLPPPPDLPPAPCCDKPNGAADAPPAPPAQAPRRTATWPLPQHAVVASSSFGSCYSTCYAGSGGGGSGAGSCGSDASAADAGCALGGAGSPTSGGGLAAAAPFPGSLVSAAQHPLMDGCGAPSPPSPRACDSPALTPQRTPATRARLRRSLSADGGADEAEKHARLEAAVLQRLASAAGGDDGDALAPAGCEPCSDDDGDSDLAALCLGLGLGAGGVVLCGACGCCCVADAGAAWTPGCDGDAAAGPSAAAADAAAAAPPAGAEPLQGCSAFQQAAAEAWDTAAPAAGAVAAI